MAASAEYKKRGGMYGLQGMKEVLGNILKDSVECKFWVCPLIFWKCRQIFSGMCYFKPKNTIKNFIDILLHSSPVTIIGMSLFT